MAEISNEEKALAGLGFSAGAAGITASAAVSTGIVAEGISSMTAAAPAFAKVAIMAGEFISSTPILAVVAPYAVGGGLIYAIYHAAKCGK